LMLIRKDDAARDFVEKIWSHRQDTVNDLDVPVCPTLGMCKNQNSLHEQEAAAKVLKEDPSLLDRVVAVPLPRDTSAPCRVAANTFKREGCFVRKQHNWDANAFSYYEGDRWSPWGAFRPGDWMAQTAGVPIWGKLIPVKADEPCHDDPNIHETEIRKQYIEDLLAESSKTRQPDKVMEPVSLGNSSASIETAN